MDSPYSVESPITAPQMPLDIVSEHQTRIWRYLRCLGCNTSDAEDLTQETFLAVLRRPFEDRGKATTAAYLQTVARNLFLKSRRTERQRTAQSDAELEASESTWRSLCDDDGGEAYLAALRECVGTLDGRSRDAVRLRYREGTSRSEMAARLGISTDGIKSLLRRVRGLLRECIERRMA